MKTENLLEVENLMIAFGRAARKTPVVRGVSFAPGRGESLAVMAESGSGKTITSLAIIGLIGKGDPSQEITGSIRFSDAHGTAREIVDLDREQMRALQGNEIAMIFQEPMTSLNPVLRVG